MFPVKHPTYTPELSGEVVDICWYQVHRVCPDLQSEVLGVNSEGIEAHRFEDSQALHSQESPMHIRACKCVDVAHVEPLS